MPAAARNGLQPLLGTLVAIQVLDPGTAPDDSIEQAFAAISRVDQRMSFHRRDSELSRINRDASRQAVMLSAPMHRVLRAALALARASDGLFDPGIASTLVDRGQLPRPADAPEAEPGASWRDIALGSDGSLRLRRPLWIDLGGIAKGHAVDCAIRVLQRAGVRSATVNAGGDLRSFGHQHEIRVRDPADPARSRPLLRIRDAAVATSAGYFSRRDGHSALVDPRDIRRSDSRQSVTVCAPRAIWADALTKVVMLDAARAAPLLRRLGAQAVCTQVDGRMQAVA